MWRPIFYGEDPWGFGLIAWRPSGRGLFDPNDPTHVPWETDKMARMAMVKFLHKRWRLLSRSSLHDGWALSSCLTADFRPVPARQARFLSSGRHCDRRKSHLLLPFTLYFTWKTKVLSLFFFVTFCLTDPFLLTKFSSSSCHRYQHRSTLSFHLPPCTAATF